MPVQQHFLPIEDTNVAISWCPGHSRIIGTQAGDAVAKPGPDSTSGELACDVALLIIGTSSNLDTAHRNSSEMYSSDSLLPEGRRRGRKESPSSDPENTNQTSPQDTPNLKTPPSPFRK